MARNKVVNIDKARKAGKPPAAEPVANTGEDVVMVAAGGIALESKAAINKHVDTALQNVDTARDSVHLACVQTLLHAAQPGPDGKPNNDYTIFQRLLKGLIANGFSNVQGLRHAVERFTPLTIQMGSDKKSFTITYHRPSSARGQRLIAANGALWAIEAFQKNPFWTLQAVRDSQARNIKAVTAVSLIDALTRTYVNSIEALADGKIDNLEAERVAKLTTAFFEVAKKAGYEQQWAASMRKAQDRADARQNTSSQEKVA